MAQHPAHSSSTLADGAGGGRLSKAMVKHAVLGSLQPPLAAEHVLTGRRSRQLDEEVGFALIGRLDPDLRDAFEGAVDRDGYRASRKF